MIKLSEVKAGHLLDLFQAVDQRVAVDIELSRGLGDIEVVLKEAVDGLEGILVQSLDGGFS